VFADDDNTIIFGHRRQILRTADMEAREHWCVARRDQQNGRVLECAIRTGYQLEAAGKELKP